MPPVVIAAGIAAVGTIGGAVLSSGAQKSAAKQAAAAQTQATDTQLQLGRENIAFQQGIYDQNRALLSPFVQRGDAAGNQINALLGLGGSPAAAQPQAQQPAAQQPGVQTPAQGYQTASPYTQSPVPGGNAAMGGNYYSYSNEGRRFDLPDQFGSESGFNGSSPNYGFLNNLANANQQNAATTPAATPAATTPATTAAPNTSAQDAFNTFANSAGIGFQLQQGTNALQHSAAARGLLQSGSTLKALQNYGQNTALNNYFLPYMGLLQGQQATGAQSGAAIAGVGSNFGNTVSNIYGGQANAIQNGADATSNAALLRGQANANLYNSAGSALGNFASSFFAPSGGGSYVPRGTYY